MMAALSLKAVGKNKTRPAHRRTDANLYPPEIQLTKASEPLFDLEGGAHWSNLTKSEDFQPMISYMLV